MKRSNAVGPEELRRMLETEAERMQRTYEEMRQAWELAHDRGIPTPLFGDMGAELKWLAVKDLDPVDISKMCTLSQAFGRFCSGADGGINVWDRMIMYRYGPVIGGENRSGPTRFRAHAWFYYLDRQENAELTLVFEERDSFYGNVVETLLHFHKHYGSVQISASDGLDEQVRLEKIVSIATFLWNKMDEWGAPAYNDEYFDDENSEEEGLNDEYPFKDMTLTWDLEASKFDKDRERAQRVADRVRSMLVDWFCGLIDLGFKKELADPPDFALMYANEEMLPVGDPIIYTEGPRETPQWDMIWMDVKPWLVISFEYKGNNLLAGQVKRGNGLGYHFIPSHGGFVHEKLPELRVLTSSAAYEEGRQRWVHTYDPDFGDGEYTTRQTDREVDRDAEDGNPHLTIEFAGNGMLTDLPVEHNIGARNLRGVEAFRDLHLIILHPWVRKGMQHRVQKILRVDADTGQLMLVPYTTKDLAAIKSRLGTAVSIDCDFKKPRTPARIMAANMRQVAGSKMYALKKAYAKQAATKRGGEEYYYWEEVIAAIKNPEEEDVDAALPSLPIGIDFDVLPRPIQLAILATDGLDVADVEAAAQASPDLNNVVNRGGRMSRTFWRQYVLRRYEDRQHLIAPFFELQPAGADDAWQPDWKWVAIILGIPRYLSEKLLPHGPWRFIQNTTFVRPIVGPGHNDMISFAIGGERGYKYILVNYYWDNDNHDLVTTPRLVELNGIQATRRLPNAQEKKVEYHYGPMHAGNYDQAYNVVNKFMYELLREGYQWRVSTRGMRISEGMPLANVDSKLPLGIGVEFNVLPKVVRMAILSTDNLNVDDIEAAARSTPDLNKIVNRGGKLSQAFWREYVKRRYAEPLIAPFYEMREEGYSREWEPDWKWVAIILGIPQYIKEATIRKRNVPGFTKFSRFSATKGSDRMVAIGVGKWYEYSYIDVNYYWDTDVDGPRTRRYHSPLETPLLAQLDRIKATERAARDYAYVKYKYSAADADNFNRAYNVVNQFMYQLLREGYQWHTRQFSNKAGVDMYISDGMPPALSIDVKRGADETPEELRARLEEEARRLNLNYEDMDRAWQLAHAAGVPSPDFNLLSPELKFLAIKDLDRRTIQAMCNTSVAFMRFCDGRDGGIPVWLRLSMYRYGPLLNTEQADPLTVLRAHAFLHQLLDGPENYDVFLMFPPGRTPLPSNYLVFSRTAAGAIELDTFETTGGASPPDQEYEWLADYLLGFEMGPWNLGGRMGVNISTFARDLGGGDWVVSDPELSFSVNSSNENAARSARAAFVDFVISAMDQDDAFLDEEEEAPGIAKVRTPMPRKDQLRKIADASGLWDAEGNLVPLQDDHVLECENELCKAPMIGTDQEFLMCPEGLCDAVYCSAKCYMESGHAGSEECGITDDQCEHCGAHVEDCVDPAHVDGLFSKLRKKKKNKKGKKEKKGKKKKKKKGSALFNFATGLLGDCIHCEAPIPEDECTNALHVEARRRRGRRRKRKRRKRKRGRRRRGMRTVKKSSRSSSSKTTVSVNGTRIMRNATHPMLRAKNEMLPVGVEYNTPESVARDAQRYLREGMTLYRARQAMGHEPGYPTRYPRTPADTDDATWRAHQDAIWTYVYEAYRQREKDAIQRRIDNIDMEDVKRDGDRLLRMSEDAADSELRVQIYDTHDAYPKAYWGKVRDYVWAKRKEARKREAKAAAARASQGFRENARKYGYGGDMFQYF